MRHPIEIHCRETGESYAEFARAIGVSTNMPGRWVSGKCTPEFKIAPKIAKRAGCDVWELYRDKLGGR